MTPTPMFSMELQTKSKQTFLTIWLIVLGGIPAWRSLFFLIEERQRKQKEGHDGPPLSDVNSQSIRAKNPLASFPRILSIAPKCRGRTRDKKFDLNTQVASDYVDEYQQPRRPGPSRDSAIVGLIERWRGVIRPLQIDYRRESKNGKKKTINRRMQLGLEVGGLSNV